jgi:DNA-binding MarR family transcriptional regulator
MKIEEEISQSRFRSAHQKAAISLLYTANWIENKMRVILGPFDITNQQYNILRILKGSHPRGLSASDMKNRMLDRNSDVSRLIDRLLVKSLVSRTQNPSDKRATDIQLTAEGLSLVDKMESITQDLDGILGALTKEEANQLSDLLDKGRG